MFPLLLSINCIICESVVEESTRPASNTATKEIVLIARPVMGSVGANVSGVIARLPFDVHNHNKKGLASSHHYAMVSRRLALTNLGDRS